MIASLSRDLLAAAAERARRLVKDLVAYCTVVEAKAILTN
jgi:hypothetical protein